MLGLADGDRLQAEILADPVLGMDDEIAHAERLQFGEEGVGVLALLLAAHEPVAKDVLLGEQLHLVIGETGFQRQHHGRRLALGGQAQRFLPALGQLHIRACLGQDRGDARAAAGGVGREQRSLACLAQRLQVIG